MRTSKLNATLKGVGEHVLDCIDGEKEPPKWLHRSHRVGHVAYLGTALLSYHWLHEHMVFLLCIIELATFFVGTHWKSLEDIDP